MIYWLLQNATDHPSLAQGIPPEGVFSAAELARLAQLRAEKRRQEWMLGRWTAKRLLQSSLEQANGQRLPLDELVVAREPNGAPVAILTTQLGPPTMSPAAPPITLPLVGMAGIKAGQEVPTITGWRLPLSLSISHSTSSAFCAVYPFAGVSGQVSRKNSIRAASQGVRPLAWVGADIEMVETRSPRFVDDYFTPQEIRHVRDASPGFQDALVTATWSVKEAVLKALRLGLTVDTRLVSCLCALHGPAEGGWYGVSVECDPKILARANRASQVAVYGWWRLEGAYALTLAAAVDWSYPAKDHGARGIWAGR